MADTRVRRVVTEDLSNVEFETSEDVEVICTFDTMGLREELLRGIYAYGRPSSLVKFSFPIPVVMFVLITTRANYCQIIFNT